MVAAAFGPLPQKWCEVPGVAGHEDTRLLGRKLENLWVVQRSQCGVGCQAHDIVASLLECSADALWRQVGVEEQTHPLRIRDVDEREQAGEVGGWTAVVGDCLVDFVRIDISVGDRETHLRW